MLNRSAAAALAAVSVLLSLTTTPCAVAGRTHLRRGSAAPKTAVKQGNYSGKRIRGGSGGGDGRKLQGTSAPAASAPAAATPAPATGNSTTPPVPQCTTLFVPAMAEALTGSYTFKGRFNNGHPVYSDAATGNNIFYESSNFYITQPSARFFLSLETDVYEPANLDGLQPWVRNNDPTCKTACTWSIRISCTTLTADAAAATPAPTPTVAAMDTNSTATAEEAVASTAAPATASPATAPPATAPPATATPATPAPSSVYNLTSSFTETSAIGGCMSLNIENGAARTGVYVLNTNQADDALLINGRPSYIGVGVNRTADQVFTVVMDVCAAGYGVVDAAWAKAVGDLSATASAHSVFLMYVAQHGGLADSAATCEVPVWLVTSGGGEDLAAAPEYTFLSLSDVEDPSEATSWAKFTPETDSSRATLEENSWISVGCAEANEVQEALEGDEEAGTGEGSENESGEGGGKESENDVPPEPTPVGSEPNGRRRLRGISVQV